MSISLPENSPSPPRQPLSPLSISSNSAPRPLTPSPNHAAAKSAPLPRIVRRKPSLRAIRHPHLDSSESSPSAHSSLYDASLQASSPDDAAAVSRTWDVPPSAVTVTTSPVRSSSVPSLTLGNPNNEIALDSPSARTERVVSAPALNNTLHTPHVLEPITERPSNTTLRTSISSRRRASFSLPTPHAPLFTSSTYTVPRFPVPPRSPHRPVLSLEELAEIAGAPAPSPHLPPRPPPPRIPTPTGLPTFNSQAAMSYRLPAPPMRRRDLFRPATPKLLEWRAQTARLPRGVVMRGDDGVMVRGRFRWAGGDVGHKSRHPWNQPTEAEAEAEADANPDSTAGYVDRLRRSTGHGPQNDVATVARRPVGGESRAAGGRSMGGNVEDRNAAAGRMRSGGSREGKRRGSTWDRVWERGCWVCCGAERGEEEGGENVGNVIVMDVRGAAGRR